MCLASFCEAHLKPHYDVPSWKTHKLVKASTRLQEKICSQHEKLIEIYCRSDQQLICYLCTMHEHKRHDTVAAVAERTERQGQLKEIQSKYQQMIQENEEKLQALKQTVDTLKRSAQTAVEDSERIFTELIRSIEKRSSEVTKLIRDQEKTELSAAEAILEQLEQEITDLKSRNSELEQLSHTDDHVHFLQSFQNLCVSSGSKQLHNIYVHQHLSFDELIRSVSELKQQVEDFCKEKFYTMSPHAAAVQIFSSEPKTREDFLKYYCRLTLDPNTACRYLILSEKDRVVKSSETAQQYPAHPERFDYFLQVLCKESVNARCYWEVEWSGSQPLYISVSYKGIGRKGSGNECRFDANNQSWSLQTSPLSFCHNNIKTNISAPPPSKIGVYVDHSAGILSFYSVSDTMTLLHTLHTTFTQPLFAGFWISYDLTVTLCEPK
uniref:B30.2/SPRY domain-containing protein n=1 Tax=Astyanax mexicanus TaxID=7994 RepID=A0A8B9K6T8_ASTMX